MITTYSSARPDNRDPGILQVSCAITNVTGTWSITVSRCSIEASLVVWLAEFWWRCSDVSSSSSSSRVGVSSVSVIRSTGAVVHSVCAAITASASRWRWRRYCFSRCCTQLRNKHYIQACRCLWFTEDTPFQKKTISKLHLDQLVKQLNLPCFLGW